MVNKLVYTIIVLSVLVLQACNSKVLTDSEFVAYIDDTENGFVQEREFKDVKYSLKLEPAEYKAIKELKMTHTKMTKLSFDSILKGYDGLYYFTFKIESIKSATESPIKSLAKSENDLARINQYSLSMLQHDFYLESGNSKEDCILFHVEDDHHISNYHIISLAFDVNKLDKNKDFAFVFNDPFFNSGLLKFNISKEMITKLPTLKFS